MHPREGRSETGSRRRLELDAGGGITRRRLLSAGAGLTLGALLAGCGSQSSGVPASDHVTIPLPRRDNPVHWPLYADNKPIASGLKPERNATLQLYNWVAYINEAVVKNFCRKYDCNYQITTFDTMADAMAKLGTGELKFDVFFPTIDVLGQLVESKTIRPLNQSYVPNMANVWADYRDPFYDRGWRYTTPYSIYTTGMAWRKDKVNLTPSWNMPWEGARYKGKVAVLDDYREGISLALLRAGILDLNTTDPRQIQRAGDALSELSRLTNVLIDSNDYTEVPTGKTWIHQAWSGDMATAADYLPKGTSIDVVGYWSPRDHRGPVANDLMVNLTSGANPVLSHLFIDYMLDVSNAIENYSYVGYMQPLSEVTASKLIAEKLLPHQLTSTVVRPEDFHGGLEELELPEVTDALWESTWNSFSEGL